MWSCLKKMHPKVHLQFNVPIQTTILGFVPCSDTPKDSDYHFVGDVSQLYSLNIPGSLKSNEWGPHDHGSTLAFLFPNVRPKIHSTLAWLP
jgi:hypothetical protein